jgi:hypothetical protein
VLRAADEETSCDGAQDTVAHDHQHGCSLASIVGKHVDIAIIKPCGEYAASVQQFSVQISGLKDALIRGVWQTTGKGFCLNTEQLNAES